MVSSISSAVSLISATSSTGSSSSSSKSDLETQLAAKQQALAAAKTAEERKSLQSEIATLQKELDETNSSSTSSSASGGSPPPQQGNVGNVGTKNFDDSTPFGKREMYV